MATLNNTFPEMTALMGSEDALYLGDVSSKITLAISIAQDLLAEFVESNRFTKDGLSDAFGTEVDETELAKIAQSIEERNFRNLPSIELVADGLNNADNNLNGAYGVYVASLDQIFLSEPFLATATVEEVVALMLEEIGHSFDAMLNDTDSTGDEGNIFANLVLGVEMSTTELAALQTEHDALTVVIDGQSVKAEAATINGTNGDDNLQGSSNGGGDTIYGYDGNDTIHGWGNASTNDEYLDGGAGDDSVGSVGNSYHSTTLTIKGGAGDDYLWVNKTSATSATLYGEDGNDTIDAQSDGEMTAYGGSGDDTIKGSGHEDYLYGGEGNDYIEGGHDYESLMLQVTNRDIGAYIDNLDGGGGDDYISGVNYHKSNIKGGTGNDILVGGSKNDTLEGGNGSDVLKGGDGIDILKGGSGNDIIYTGDLSQGESDQVYGGDGADTFFMGETTADITTTTTTSTKFNFGELALSLTTDIMAVGFTAFAPSVPITSKVVPLTFKALKGLISDDSGTQVHTETIKDATESTYATVHDFNPLEDIFIVPLASDEDVNIDINSNSGTGAAFTLDYNNGSGRLAAVHWDNSLNLDRTAKDAYYKSLLSTALIIEDGSVKYGTNNNIDLSNHLNNFDFEGMTGRYMIMGAYAGQVLQGDNTANNLLGTNLGDVLYGYTPLDSTLGSTYAPQSAGNDYLYGFGGDDLFYGGNGDNYIYGGDDEGTVYNDSDTVSYEAADSDKGITVDMIANADSDFNGSYFTVEHSFVSNSGVGGADRLYDIENIIGTKFDDTITGNNKSNTLMGGDGNDTLNGGGTTSDAFGKRTVHTSGVFSHTKGWSSFDKTPRQMADVNGDGFADIVGFGNNNVFVHLGQGDGTFGDEKVALADRYVNEKGWTRFDTRPRQVADVNGDGLADIVGFGTNNVLINLGQADGTFEDTQKVSTSSFTFNRNWSTFDSRPRQLADVNGDGRADIVGFGTNDVFVALGQANGLFESNINTGVTNFAHNDGWTSFDSTPVEMGDVNGDGQADIVGFDTDAVYVALGQVNGTFGTVQEMTLLGSEFTDMKGWDSFDDHPRQLADIDGDGMDDIVGFGSSSVRVAYSTSSGNSASFGNSIAVGTDALSTKDGWASFDALPRMVTDVNGDGNADLVGLGANGVQVVLAHDDELIGGEGNDILNGGAGNDILRGRANGDTATVNGFMGDELNGGTGNDLLVGGSGNDKLTGGSGRDIFALDSDDGIDTITDFNKSEGDVIRIDRSVFSLGSGALTDGSISYANNELSVNGSVRAKLQSPIGFALANGSVELVL